VEAGIDRRDTYVTNTVKHSSGSRAASAASTRSRTHSKSLLAVRGWMSRSVW
jgi:hypothetical protein